MNGWNLFYCFLFGRSSKRKISFSGEKDNVSGCNECLENGFNIFRMINFFVKHCFLFVQRKKGNRDHSDMNGEEISCQGKELSPDSVGLLYSVLGLRIQLPSGWHPDAISEATELSLLAQ